MKNLIVKLKTRVEISELIQYYHAIKEFYQHRKWVRDEHVDTTNADWYNSSTADHLHGYAIDSNLVSLADICPPVNITTKPTVDYRNTELAFGVINELQSIFPYGFRWAISVLEPNGYVNLHTDSEENVTVWVPIINPKDTWLMMEYENELTEYNLPADGSLYVVDTKYPHCTKNNSNQDRVLLTFRCNRELYLTDLLSK
jgi:hypothetical protein